MTQTQHMTVLEYRMVGGVPAASASKLRDHMTALCGAEPRRVRLHEMVLRPAPGVEGIDRNASVRLVHQLHLEEEEGEGLQQEEGEERKGAAPGGAGEQGQGRAHGSPAESGTNAAPAAPQHAGRPLPAHCRR